MQMRKFDKIKDGIQSVRITPKEKSFSVILPKNNFAYLTLSIIQHHCAKKLSTTILCK